MQNPTAYSELTAVWRVQYIRVPEYVRYTDIGIPESFATAKIWVARKDGRIQEGY